MEYIAGFRCEVSYIHLLFAQLLVYLLPIATVGAGIYFFRKARPVIRVVMILLSLLLAPVIFFAAYFFILPWGCPLLGF